MKAVLADTQERLAQCLAVRSKVFVDEQQVPPDLELDDYDASPKGCRHWLVLGRVFKLSTEANIW